MNRHAGPFIAVAVMAVLVLALPTVATGARFPTSMLRHRMPEPAFRSAAMPTDSASDPDGDGLGTWFELRYGLDPNDPDSNGDGIRDGAEDPDGDGLSNAGEQRFGTDPQLTDSDHDGISDWAEDSDGDGRPNGLQQDERGLPANLVPSLQTAFVDAPASYRDGCHLGGADVKPKAGCLYGDPAGSITVVLYGDLHAAAWLPAITAVGARQGWRVVSVTRSACPAADVTPALNGTVDKHCTTWHKNALAYIAGLHADLVIASSYERYPLATNGRPAPARRWGHLWQAGLTRTLLSLDELADSVIYLDEVPHQAGLMGCLQAHSTDIARCERRRSTALAHSWRSLDIKAAAAASVSEATVTGLVCPYDPCPVVVDSHLIYRDDTHITATYSRVLAPGLERIIDADASLPATTQGVSYARAAPASLVPRPQVAADDARPGVRPSAGRGHAVASSVAFRRDGEDLSHGLASGNPSGW